MIEVKTVGRGGQGAVTFSQLLAIAAFEQGFKVVQAMPKFGVERRGAPAESYTRLSKEACTGYRSLIYEPGIVVVLDSTLIHDTDVTAGLKKDGLVIVNSNKSSQELGLGKYKTFISDASSVALKIFKSDIVNTAMLGAFAKATGIVSLDSINKAIDQRFEGKKSLIALNKQAVKEVFDES